MVMGVLYNRGFHGFRKNWLWHCQWSSFVQDSVCLCAQRLFQWRTISQKYARGSTNSSFHSDCLFLIKLSSYTLNIWTVCSNFLVTYIGQFYQCGVEMIRRDLLMGQWTPYLERAVSLKPCYEGGINGGEVNAPSCFHISLKLAKFENWWSPLLKFIRP